MSRWVGGWGIVVGDLIINGDVNINGELDVTDVDADVEFFEDIIINNAVRGFRVNVHRNAAEGIAHVYIGIDDAKVAVIGGIDAAANDNGIRIVGKENAYFHITNDLIARISNNDMFIFEQQDGTNLIEIPCNTGNINMVTTLGTLIVARLTVAQRNALAPVDGMIIYQTDDDQFEFRENGAWVTK